MRQYVTFAVYDTVAAAYMFLLISFVLAWSPRVMLYSVFLIQRSRFVMFNSSA